MNTMHLPATTRLLAAALGLALAVAACLARAAHAQDAAPRTGSSSLKAGYEFDPVGVAGAVTHLFAIDPSGETLDVSAIDENRVSRRIDIVRNPGPGEDRVRVEIGVSQDPVDPFASVGEFITNFFFASDSGDHFFRSEPTLGSTGRVSDDGATILFTQSNIFIMLQQVSGSTGSLLQMAQEIFAQIKSLPSVGSLPLPTASLTTFPVPGVTNLVEGQQQEFTVSEFDPSGGPLTRSYVAPDGEVILTGPNPVYKAGSTVGAQTLQFVVTTPSLLSGAATLVFNVTP